MPDAISIRRISGLPPASFRFHLAMDTLAIGYVLGATSCTRDFHPLERAHAGRTKKTSPEQPPRRGLLPDLPLSAQAAYFLAFQLSLSPTARLRTGVPGLWSTRSVTKYPLRSN